MYIIELSIVQIRKLIKKEMNYPTMEKEKERGSVQKREKGKRERREREGEGEGEGEGEEEGREEKGTREHKNTPLRAHFGCSRYRGREGGCRSPKTRQNGVLLVFEGGGSVPINEHVRHTHMGVPYVFCGMWGWGWWPREGGGWIMRNTPHLGVFLIAKWMNT